MQENAFFCVLYSRGTEKEVCFMPREARIKGDDLTYHIVTRGNNKMQAFHDDEDYNKYYDILRKYKKEIPFELYHFCLMSNHPHLLKET
jgi:putative transposase